MTLSEPPTAWIFDVDGVLTNPTTKRVMRHELFDELIKRLQNGDPIGLNTGRSADFVIQKVLQILALRIGDKSLLKTCVAFAEKGAITITFNERGESEVSVNKQVQIPDMVRREIKDAVSKYPYSEIMFFDETKKTMISLEMKSGKQIRDFKELQKELVPTIAKILEITDSENDFRIDTTAICTDIESKKVGKAMGTKMFTRWLEKKGIAPKRYICFGDSPSDIEMLEELEKQGKRVLFVYVGNRKDVTRKATSSVVYTDRSADEGTLLYLQGSDK